MSMSISNHCPICGQQGTPMGFSCGYGSPDGCKYGSQYGFSLLPVKFTTRRDNIPYQHVRTKEPECIMCDVYQQQLIRERGIRQDLYELLEYERMRNYAYSMLWSAREYLYVTDALNFDARGKLTCALNELEAERVDGQAIRKKYIPYIPNATKPGYTPSPEKNVLPKNQPSCVYDTDPCAEIVVQEHDWKRHWRYADETFGPPGIKPEYWLDREKCGISGFAPEDGYPQGPKC